MEGLELDVGRRVPQEIHHRLEVFAGRNVPHHDAEVAAVQQQLSQELEGPPPGHVVAVFQEQLVVLEHHVEVGVEKRRRDFLVLRGDEEVAERVEGVGRHLEVGQVHVRVEELPQVL